jgi:hypothetical protein
LIDVERYEAEGKEKQEAQQGREKRMQECGEVALQSHDQEAK